MVKKDELVNCFDEICVSNLNDEILDKCVELCGKHALSEEDLVDTWTAFSAMHLNFQPPTVDTLLRMEKEQLLKPQHKRAAVKPKPNIAPQSGYSTPQRAKPESILSASHDPDASPAIFSPSSYSPAIFTPSRKPAASTGSGKVVCQLGEEGVWGASEGSTTPSRVELLATGTAVLTEPQRYMFEPLHLSRAVLADHIERLGSLLVERNQLSEPIPSTEPSIEEAVVVGRVACDAEDSKLTASSAVLVSATEREEVALNLQGLPVHALFPGQVVAMKATNPTSRQLRPTQMFADVTPSWPQQPIAFPADQGPLQIVVASGPFTHSDALTYEPLQALVQYVKQHKPHLLVLIGPFLDEAHQAVQGSIIKESFLDFFLKLLKETLEPLKSVPTHVVLVASARDVHHHPVYPTPPFVLPAAVKKELPTNVTLAPDPCLLSVGGLVVGITATDVLMHLGRCEIASGGSDRLGRLASHVLHQATFYPLYPPAPQLPLQLELWERFAQLPVRPHVLVLPSDLRCFLKEVEGALVVNPEHLAKGVGGGSFARLEVHQPDRDASFSVAKNVRAQVLKI